MTLELESTEVEVVATATPPVVPQVDPPAPPVPPVPPVPPDHRDMYLLIAGLVIGLVLSPWGIGRFMEDDAYVRWYYGGGAALNEFQAFANEHAQEVKNRDTELLDRLKATGVTKEAVDEMRNELFAQAQAEVKPYEEAMTAERAVHETWYRGLLFAMIVASVILMFLEPLFEATGPLSSVRRRLVTGRYGLLAIWLGFALAKPHVLAGTSWLFALLAVAVVAGAAGVAMMGASAEEAEM